MTAKCIGCYQSTEGVLIFQGSLEWRVAALTVICECSEKEALGIIERGRRQGGRYGLQAKLVPSKGDTLCVACCQACGDRGHFDVTVTGEQANCYVEVGYTGNHNTTSN